MNRLGPGELTLAEIAHDAGVTAGALAQRFGSKRALLLALSERAAQSAGDLIRGLARSHRSPLAAIRAYATCMAAMAQSPSALARSLAYLQIDIADPEFRVHLATQSRATHEGLVELFESAIEKREVIRGANPSKLAHMIEALVSGSLLTWAAFDETR